MKPADKPTPTWTVPSPYGYPRALESAGSVAAPLLAGFAVAVIAQIAAQPDKIRWVDAALAVLSLATVLLVFAVQIAFNARQWVVEPGELESWWPDHDDPDRWGQLRADQARYATTFKIAADRFRRVFNAGLLLLMIGLAAALVPKNDLTAARAVGIIIFAFAALIELWWLVQNWASTLGAPGQDPFSPRRR